jgi:hypothetical protein
MAKTPTPAEMKERLAQWLTETTTRETRIIYWFAQGLLHKEYIDDEEEGD